MPQRMRHDVRLLGDLLGEILRESEGEDLLADVERLRHAVIGARRGRPPLPIGADPGAVRRPGRGRDHRPGRVLAAGPGRAGGPRLHRLLHLVNLAEEHQRIRTLRERDTGAAPLRESLARPRRVRDDAALRRRGRRQRGRAARRPARAPVLTAHPTEARRRAVTSALRRISGLLTALDEARGDRRPGAEGQAEALRLLREEIDLLWRTSQLRVKAMEPLDEVRTVMTAFDETLFRVVRRSTGRSISSWPGRTAAGCPLSPRRSCGSAAGSAGTATATRS